MSDLTLSPVLTSAGMAAVAAADGQGFQVKITAVAIGDGAYDIRDGDGYPLAAAKAKTELDSEQIRTDVYAGAVTGPQQVVVEARIDAGNPNFWVKEIGFFLDDGTLFAVWSSATDNLGYRGGLVPWVFRFVLSWTQLPDGAVTVEFNGDAAYADISGRLTDHIGDPLAHTGLFPFRGIQVYDAAGTYEWAVPEGVTKAWVIVTGGGGASGPCPIGSVRGSGGGSGGTAMKLVDLTEAETVAITVGAGGAVTTAVGGTSSFGAVVSATGGAPGGLDVGMFNGGHGGNGVGGDLNLIGGDGEDTFNASGANSGYVGGYGGASYWGGGARSGAASTERASNSFGTGGPGDPGGRNPGADGVVVIQW